MITLQDIPIDEINDFWDKQISYLVDDRIVTEPEEIEYFSGEEYRGVLVDHMKREPDKQHMVYFYNDGDRIGAASYCTYKSEDGKCFILDFWLFPEYRKKGLGHRCYRALEESTKEDGAVYYELNCTREDAIRFWKSLGFTENGNDEWGMPLYIKRENEPR